MSPKTKTVLLILLCFVLGAAAGFIAQRYYSGAHVARRPDYAQARNEFAKRLQLDSLQLSRVDSLLDIHRKKMDDIRKLYTIERDTLRAEIRQLLNPNQDRIYDQFVKELDARRHEGEHPSAK